MKAASVPVQNTGALERRYAFASYLMLPLKPEMLVVEDTHLDKRFPPPSPPLLRSMYLRASLLQMFGRIRTIHAASA